MEPNTLLVYVTHPDSDSARRVVERLLQERLIACANSYPVKSMYRWRGKIEKDSEVVTVLKTTPRNWEKLSAEIASIHPYEVPCIIRIEGVAVLPFAEYLREETGSR